MVKYRLFSGIKSSLPDNSNFEAIESSFKRRIHQEVILQIFFPTITTMNNDKKPPNSHTRKRPTKVLTLGMSRTGTKCKYYPSSDSRDC